MTSAFRNLVRERSAGRLSDHGPASTAGRGDVQLRRPAAPPNCQPTLSHITAAA